VIEPNPKRPSTRKEKFKNLFLRLITHQWGWFLVSRGNWTPLRPTFWLEYLPLRSTEFYKKLGEESWKKSLTIWPQKGGKKFGVKNCAQLPVNKKSIPDAKFGNSVSNFCC
jgi:hypothetical protein